ncbi:multidrug resistance protein MdtA precursor [mine drainage metagenome]|uniref:Multidrug resistance protein MdtA n=1 Tax=mine drainage metagenome TaxID=410659 RepID=A0A1J5SXN5_9ZZZZ
MKRILVLVLPLVLAACGKPAAPAPAVERPASTIVVGTEAADSGNVYSGEVHARYEAVLGFRIGGKIVERLVDTGGLVKKGQVLARLDAADTGLQENAATAQYRLAEEELKRYRELRDKGFVSQSALDAKETALEAAAAQAGLARNQAAYTSLLSDRDGVVSATFAEVGQVVSAGQPVVRVAQQGEREVTFGIPESRFGSVKVGMPADIELAATSSNSMPTALKGHVREISPAADPASRTYPVRVSFDAGNAKVPLGMTARVKLRISGNDASKGGGYLVPLTAIFQQGEQAAVWIVAADHSVSLHPVGVSAYLDDGALVSSGVAPGERIVSAGVHKLSAGEKIQIIDGGRP